MNTRDCIWSPKGLPECDCSFFSGSMYISSDIVLFIVMHLCKEPHSGPSYLSHTLVPACTLWRNLFLIILPLSASLNCSSMQMPSPESANTKKSYLVTHAVIGFDHMIVRK